MDDFLNLLTIMFMPSRPSFTLSSGLKPFILKLLTALEKKLFIVSATCFSVEIILSPSINVMFLGVTFVREKWFYYAPELFIVCDIVYV